MAAADPDRAAGGAGRESPGAQRRRVIHLHIGGSRAALGAGDGAPLPPSRPVHRANRPQAVNEGRADFVPMFFSDIPAVFRSGRLPLDAVFANVTPPDVTGSARWACRWRRCMRRSTRRRPSSCSSTRRSRGRWASPSSTSARSTWPSRSTSRPTSMRGPRSARWSGRSARSSRSWSRTAPPCSSGSARSRAAPRSALRTRRTWGSTPRCSRMPSWTSLRRACHRGPRSATGARSSRVPHGDVEAVPVHPRQPDGRDAAGRLHERHPLIRQFHT